MRTLRLKIADLFAFEGKPPGAQPPDVVAITALVASQFGFLPQPVNVHVEGDEVVISFPEEAGLAQAEAKRLADKAAKRAQEGNYSKAIDIFKRALELQPSLHSARRDLAMAYVEVGDVENATNHLIEVLRLDPRDAWSLVVLANLYIREKSDPVTGEKFLRKALEIKPDDVWALNSLATVSHKRGKTEEAIALFERAISANPDFANAYYGQAVAFEAAHQNDKAIEALERLFGRAKMQDVRSQPVFDNARKLYTKLQAEVATRNHSEAFKCIQTYKAEMEALSGCPIRIEEGDFEDRVGARLQAAWKHGRDFHLISTRRGYSPELLSHLEAHELTHLKMESEARALGKNLFFATTAKTRETAIRSVSSDLHKWQKQGYSEESITKVTQSMVVGLCGFLFNCPLDMLIERYIRGRFTVLHAAQFLSVRVMAMEAWQTNSNPDIRRLTPRKIMQASLALNGAFGLFLDDLFQGASAFAAPYRSLDTFGLSQRLYQHWLQRSQNIAGGGSYELVDEFADRVGLRDWYEWRPDPGHHEVTAPPTREGTTNPELLRQKHPAAVWHLLNALERYDALPVEKVREIAFEIAILGQQGLDHASPDQKYTLRSLPGERFSGLHLMCLMYAGFKRVAPDHEVQMDLNDPFLTALQMHKDGGAKH
ncbi:MAG: tetratricopeptide repeat protein [Verrucomicrobia bacterium]|nr:tetratricopeptide repeat protein [Verrucomicrobiota bacterium]